VFGDVNAAPAEMQVDGFRPGDQRLTFADMRANGGTQGPHLLDIFPVLERVAIALRRSAAIYRTGGWGPAIF
jgi:hypothetical protein